MGLHLCFFSDFFDLKMLVNKFGYPWYPFNCCFIYYLVFVLIRDIFQITTCTFPLSYTDQKYITTNKDYLRQLFQTSSQVLKQLFSDVPTTDWVYVWKVAFWLSRVLKQRFLVVHALLHQNWLLILSTKSNLFKSNMGRKAKNSKTFFFRSSSFVRITWNFLLIFSALP